MDCPIRALKQMTHPLSWRPIVPGEEATPGTNAGSAIFANDSDDDEPDRKRKRLLMAAATVLDLKRRDPKPPPTLHRKPLDF